MSGTMEEDVILRVTGVSSATLLERLAAARSGRHAEATAPQRHHRQSAHEVRGGRWSLADFGDGTDEAFVVAAHQVLLRRPVTAVEAERRLRDLRNGASRLEVLVRLALCPEGRRAQGQPLRGVFLPTVLHVGRAVERRLGDSTLENVARRGRPAVGLVAGHSPGAVAARRAAVRLGVVTTATLLVRRDRTLRARLAQFESAGRISR